MSDQLPKPDQQQAQPEPGVVANVLGIIRDAAANYDRLKQKIREDNADLLESIRRGCRPPHTPS